MMMIFGVYACIDLYLFARSFSMLRGAGPIRGVVCGAIALLSLAFPCARILHGVLPQSVSSFLTYIGSWYLAPMVCGLVFAVAADVLRAINGVVRITRVSPPFTRAGRVRTVKVIMLLTAIVCGAGAWNATTMRVVSHEIEFAARGDRVGSALMPAPIKIAMISDTHVGMMTGLSRLQKAVSLIAPESPDIVLLVGDIIDDVMWSDDEEIVKEYGSIMRSLAPRLGVFAVLGNHEYYADADACISLLEKEGVRVLRDEWAMPGGEVTIVGRDDGTSARYGRDRAELADIIATIPTQMLEAGAPMIVLDHQPMALEDAEKAGACLQLSGHTHKGQIIPMNFIVDMLFEKSYGLYKKGSTTYYISCGAGTWGPPVRTSGRPEVVLLTVRYRR